jgi:asparagine synthase (glutamine-hydrolysing)
MCGIAGFLCDENDFFYKNLSNLNNIKNTLNHRGPDDFGIWYDKTDKIGFAHTRLSIQDLSSAGHQPMISFSKRFMMIYNGEIYNHLDLKNKLITLAPNITWKGKSDTETLLNSFEHIGIEKTLSMCTGMFAISIWDFQKKELILIRDRFGEKPLYFGMVQNNFIFGSELKVFKTITKIDNKISRESLNLFLRFGYVPGPRSIYDNIFKLPPGSLLKIKRTDLKDLYIKKNINFKKFNIKFWWNAKNKFNSLSSTKFYDSENAIKHTEKTLVESIKSQLISDVPLGTFLSGGIDSSLVTTLMQKKLSMKIKTFTIGFEEQNYDESKYAKKIANYLGTDHNELILNQTEALNIIPTLSKVYDEPFADSSQIPTILLSKFAKKNITVALTGDGGDELFGGYNRYIFLKNFWKKISILPYPLRRYFAKSLKLFPINFIDSFKGIFNLISNSNVVFFGDKVAKFSHKMQSVKNLDDLYLSSLSTYQETSKLLLNSIDESEKIFKLKDNLNYCDYESLMMFIDSQTYLIDDILCKVDRASMSTSLETRVPFLDKNVVELAWSLPTSMKIKDGKGKWILREILKKYVPQKYTERPKMGFGIPLGDWLREELKDWGEELINKKNLQNEGYFNSELVTKLWNEHQTKKRDWQSVLWPILMFQAWKKEN